MAQVKGTLLHKKNPKNLAFRSFLIKPKPHMQSWAWQRIFFALNQTPTASQCHMVFWKEKFSSSTLWFFCVCVFCIGIPIASLERFHSNEWEACIFFFLHGQCWSEQGLRISNRVETNMRTGSPLSVSEGTFMIGGRQTMVNLAKWCLCKIFLRH